MNRTKRPNRAATSNQIINLTINTCQYPDSDREATARQPDGKSGWVPFPGMGDFRADTEALQDLAPALSDQAEHAEAANLYVKNYGQLFFGEGWINDFSGAHETIQQDTQDWFADLSRYVLESASEQVREAVNHYETADADTAASFDAGIEYNGTLQEYDTSSGPIAEGTMTAFRPVLDPTAQIDGPPPDYNTDPGFQYNPTWFDYTSISGASRALVIEATTTMAGWGWIERSFDPYEVLCKPVVGDWASMRACTDVFNNVASFVEDLESNVMLLAHSIPHAWEGNAADACIRYLELVCEDLRSTPETFRALAKQYEEAAQACSDFRGVVATIISDLIEAVIIFVTAIAAGAATSPTVVGGIAGGAVAVYEGWRIIEFITTFEDLRQRTDAVMKASSGEVAALMLSASEFQLPWFETAGGETSPMRHLPGD